MLHADPIIVRDGDACATDRALEGLVELRRYAETRYAAKTWGATDRRVVARIEASSFGLDIRFVVTSLADGSAEQIYDTLYSARGQAENLIKLHKTLLKSDRTSCRSANANQMRLILDTAAYWLMWAVRHALPTTTPLRTAEFATIRLRLLKVAARHRNRQPYPHRLRQRIPRCRALPIRRTLAANGGHLTGQERSNLNRRENNVSDNIYRDKHNDIAQPGVVSVGAPH